MYRNRNISNKTIILAVSSINIQVNVSIPKNTINSNPIPIAFNSFIINMF